MSEPSVDWICKFDETPIPQQTGMEETSVPAPSGDLSQERNECSFPSGNSLPEEDDELTESKIRDFLHEKVFFYSFIFIYKGCNRGNGLYFYFQLFPCKMFKFNKK